MNGSRTLRIFNVRTTFFAVIDQISPCAHKEATIRIFILSHHQLNKAAKSRVKLLEKMQRMQQKFMKGAAAAAGTSAAAGSEIFSATAECSQESSDHQMRAASSLMDVR